MLHSRSTTHDRPTASRKVPSHGGIHDERARDVDLRHSPARARLTKARRTPETNDAKLLVWLRSFTMRLKSSRGSTGMHSGTWYWPASSMRTATTNGRSGSLREICHGLVETQQADRRGSTLVETNAVYRGLSTESRQENAVKIHYFMRSTGCSTNQGQMLMATIIMTVIEDHHRGPRSRNETGKSQSATGTPPSQMIAPLGRRLQAAPEHHPSPRESDQDNSMGSVYIQQIIHP